MTIYCNVQVLINSELGMLPLFKLASCILQGCPLAGIMFAMAVDPILRAFNSAMDHKGLGVARACADDIGCVLNDLNPLSILFVFSR